MTPRLIRLTEAASPQARSDLARHAAGLDLTLHAFGADHALMPPALWQALEARHGTTRLQVLLGAAGLQDQGPIRWAAAARRSLRLADASDGSDSPVSAGLSWLDNLLPQPPIDWHLDCCRVREAWQSLGTEADRPEIDWQDLRFGHIDTGYTAHPAFGFQSTTWVQEGLARSFDGDQQTQGAHDAMRGAAAGHGTSSGSIVCGADTGPHRYYGAAPRLPLVPVHIDDCYILDKRADEFEAAVRYLVDEVGVPIINVSMGTFLKCTAPPPIARAVDHCYDRGVLMIAAAGNIPLHRWPAYPAALPRSIGVSGITPNLRPWWLSSSGDWVDFSAPGRQVRRAQVNKDAHAQQGLSYGYTSTLGGTTFATAMTSGIAAMWLLKHGEEIQHRYPEGWQRIEAFRAMVTRNAIIPDGWSASAGFGAGIVDAAALMDAQRLPAPASLVRR